MVLLNNSHFSAHRPLELNYENNYDPEGFQFKSPLGHNYDLWGALQRSGGLDVFVAASKTFYTSLFICCSRIPRSIWMEKRQSSVSCVRFLDVFLLNKSCFSCFWNTAIKKALPPTLFCSPHDPANKNVCVENLASCPHLPLCINRRDVETSVLF